MDEARMNMDIILQLQKLKEDFVELDKLFCMRDAYGLYKKPILVDSELFRTIDYTLQFGEEINYKGHIIKREV